MRNNTARYLAAILMLSLLTMAASCDKYQKAGQLAKDAAATALVAQQLEISYFEQGKITPATHHVIQQKFLQLAEAGQRLDQAINETHSAPNAKAAINASLAALEDLSGNGLTGIQDKQTKWELQAAFLSVQVILNNISALSQ